MMLALFMCHHFTATQVMEVDTCMSSVLPYASHILGLRLA